MTDNLPAVMSFDNMLRLAESIAKSGMFGMKTPDQALVLMAIAQAEGRHPALAARDYHVIQNTPAKKADAMLRDFLSGGGKVEWHTLTDEVAEATFSHPQGGSVTLRWDKARVRQAGINNPMHNKYPRQMLRSRLISEGVRTIYPMATGGFYVPEEVGDMDREPLNVTPPKAVEKQVDNWRAEKEARPTETTWADAGLDLDALIAQGNVACRDIEMLQEWWTRHLRPDQRGVLGAKGKGVGPYLPGWKEGEIQTIQSAAPSPTAQSPEAEAAPHHPAAPPPGETSEDGFGLKDNRSLEQIFSDNVFAQVAKCRTLDEVENVEAQWKPQIDDPAKLSRPAWLALSERIGSFKKDLQTAAANGQA